MGRVYAKYPMLSHKQFIILVATWGEGGRVMWEYHKEFNDDGLGFDSVQELQEFLEKKQYPTNNITDSLLAEQARKDWQEYVRKNRKHSKYIYILIDPFSKRSIELLYERK